MAKCSVNILADNGRPSILFKRLANVYGDPQKAIDLYYYTKTDEFKKAYGDWASSSFNKSKLDLNGEPTFESLTEDAYLDDIDWYKTELDERADIYKALSSIIPSLSNALQRQINSLEYSGKNNALLSSIKNLKNILTEGNVESSIPKFLIMANKNLHGLKKKVDKANREFNGDIRLLSSYNKIAQSYGVLKDLSFLLNSTPGIAEIINTTESAADNSLSLIDDIESIYLHRSIDFLTEEFHKRDKSWAKKDIKKWLRTAERDSLWVEQMLEYMGDSPDKVLSMVGEIVMNTEHEVRLESIEFNDRLTDVVEKVEREYSGKASEIFDDVLYVKDDGTTHILSTDVEFTNGANPQEDIEYRKIQKIKASRPALYEFLVFFNEEYAALQQQLPAGAVSMGTRIPSVLKSTWERAQGKTVKEKYELAKDAVDKSLKGSNLDTHKGVITDAGGNIIKRIPIFYTKKYDSRDFKPEFDRIKKELISEGYSLEDADDLARTRAEVIATKKMSKFISRDLAYTLQSFHAMSTNYAKKNAVIEVLDSAMAVVGSKARKYTLTSSAGAKLMRLGKNLTKEEMFETGDKSRTKEVMEQFLESKVYGITQKDLGSFSIMGRTFDTNKTLRTINNSSSMINIALSVTAALSSLSMGEYSNFNEAVGGEFFTLKNYHKASKKYLGDMAGILGDIGQRKPTSLIGLMDEHYNLLQDFNNQGKVKVSEGSTAKRMMKTNLLFFLSNSGEHFMQLRASMALMDGIDTYDKSGTKKGTLLDAHKVVDGKLHIDDVYIKGKTGELVKYDKSQQFRITNKMNALNRKLQGNYSSITANKAKQDARTALVMKFRDWAYEMFINRYGNKNNNRMLEQDREGFYRTSYRVGGKLLKDLRTMQLQLAKEDWSKLTPHEKANIRKMIVEVSTITLLGIASAMLGFAGKDMDDKYGSDKVSDRLILGSFRLFTYQTNRLFTEVFSFANPKEFLRLMQTPAAATSVLEDTINLVIAMSPSHITDRYTTGWRKGELKVTAKAAKLIPVYKQLRVLNPDGLQDKILYINQ